MINDVKNGAEARMKKSLEALKNELSKLRTGRAHTGLMEHISVDYYGSAVPLSQVAQVAVEDARTLTVTPWDRTMVQAIEKAIMTSDLGLNPATSGTVIRVPMPAFTEQRRKEMIKVVHKEGEAAKVAIRNIRRDSNGELKNLLKAKSISEDDERGAADVIQKLTDKYIAEIDKVVEAKEKDMMEI
ncbi:MAG TPA: ribosome recycling factor [Gammaproteobacteria bacterium]